jgi:hypothetical protein
VRFFTLRRAVGVRVGRVGAYYAEKPCHYFQTDAQEPEPASYDAQTLDILVKYG